MKKTEKRKLLVSEIDFDDYYFINERISKYLQQAKTHDSNRK